LEIELHVVGVERGFLMPKCLQKEIASGARGTLLRRLVSDKRGQELVEFALIFPILIMLLMGIFWMGRMISVYQALGFAAREGARVALAPTCASCGDTNNYAAAQAAVNNALTAAALKPGPAMVSFPNATPMNSGDPANYQVTEVTITVQYPVQITIPFTSLNGTTIWLSSTATMRQEF
jgi:Flp pilus assembly protein TadG